MDRESHPILHRPRHGGITRLGRPARPGPNTTHDGRMTAQGCAAQRGM